MKFKLLVGGCLITMTTVSGITLFYHKCLSKYNSVVSEEPINYKRDTIPEFIDSPLMKDSTKLCMNFCNIDFTPMVLSEAILK